jgi:hypothetical protein
LEVYAEDMMQIPLRDLSDTYENMSETCDGYEGDTSEICVGYVTVKHHDGTYWPRVGLKVPLGVRHASGIRENT